MKDERALCILMMLDDESSRYTVTWQELYDLVRYYQKINVEQHEQFIDCVLGEINEVAR